jgi:hypothetical protein
MADSLTVERLAARRRWKRWTLPALGAAAGLAAAIWLDYRPFAALGNLCQTWILALNIDVRGLAAHGPSLQWVADLIVAPCLSAILMLGISDLWPTRRLIDLAFPDPPAFVQTDLENLRRMSTVLVQGSVTKLVGREAERAELLALLDVGHGAASFQWRFLLGTSGIGKSRLALDWLEQARLRGWDIGVLDPCDLALISNWHPRRPTALVMEEPCTRWQPHVADIISEIATRSTVRKPLRMLVVDQISPRIASQAAVEQMLQATECRPPLCLQPLPDADIRSMLAGKVADVEVDRLTILSAGRPRAAIMFVNVPVSQSYGDALRRWSELLIKELKVDTETPDRSTAIPLILAAMVGPLPADQARAILGTLDPGPLVRFFDNCSRSGIERELPRLLPEDVAQELALRLLAKLDPHDRTLVADLMLHEFPMRLEAGLAAIWRNRPELAEDESSSESWSVTLRWLQERYDATNPERVSSLSEYADVLAYEIGNVATMDEVDLALDSLISLAASRPFDSAFSLAEARGAANAVRRYGPLKRWGKLDRCGERLVAIAEKPKFVRDREIRIAEAAGSSNAIFSYGAARRWADLERWGDRLISISREKNFQSDLEIQLIAGEGAIIAIRDYGIARRGADLSRWLVNLMSITRNHEFLEEHAMRVKEAQGINNAILGYGSSEQWDSVEELGRSLIALVQCPKFSSDPVIRQQEATGATHAMFSYGHARRWKDLERWGDRLIRLVDDPRFSCIPPIRRAEAMAAANSISFYGQAENWDRLERWGGRLVSLAEDHRFAGDYGLRLEEARGAFNAIAAYSEAGRSDDLERWGKRTIALAESSMLDAEVDIRVYEGRSAVTAMCCYGKSGRWRELEGWGQRLTSLADDSRFCSLVLVRQLEAEGAADAIDHYGERGLQGSTNEQRWRRRLAFAAQAFPTDPEMQTLAKRYDLGWASQMRRNFTPYGRSSTAVFSGC